MKIITFTLLLFALGCSKSNSDKKTVAIEKSSDKNEIILHKLDKLFAVGDFDGDKKADTIFQHNYSGLTQSEIEFSPDPEKSDWDDTIVNWFYKQESDVYLAFNKKDRDTLHLGTGQGLYCLLNIGDINADGKDELALVIDLCDYSRMNSCRIFSLCHGKWTYLKRFGVHEGAFDWEKGKKPDSYTSIKGFLEKENNVWKFSDYEVNDYNTEEEVGQMKILQLKKCN